MAKLTEQMLERAQALLGNRREQLHAAWKQKNPKPESTERSLMGALKIALKDKSFNAKLLKAAAAEDARGCSYPAITVTVTVLCEWFPAVAAAYDSNPYFRWCEREEAYTKELCVRTRRLLDEALFKDMDSEVLLQAIDDFNDNGIEV